MCVYNELKPLKTAILSKRDTSALKDRIQKLWPTNAITFANEKNFKVYELEKGKRILIGSNFIAVELDDQTVVPFLGTAALLVRFPSVVVDMGAVQFVCNGAKIMRPGITSLDNFKRGDIVTVKDEKFSKTLAVGKALQDSDIAASNNRGYVIDNLHYVGDQFWETYKEINK